MHRDIARAPLTLVTMAVATIAALWLLFFEHISHDRVRELDAIAQRDANLAVAVSYYVERIQRTAFAVNSLVASSVTRDSRDEPTTALLRNRAAYNDVLAELAVCRPGGHVLSSRAEPMPLTRERCRAVLASGGTGELQQIVPPADGGFATFETTFLAGDGQAAVVSVISVPTLLGAVSRITLRDETVVLLMLGQQPVAAWDSRSGQFTLVGRFNPKPAGDRGPQGWLFQRHSMPSGLDVYVATREADALESHVERRNAHLALTLVLTAAVLVAAWALRRSQHIARRHAESLESAQARLESANALLETTVQARTAELRQANKDLQSFAYSVAHDLKGPLGIIRGFADVLEPVLERTGDDKSVHYIQRIKANATHLVELTEHLLQLGRIEAKLHLRPVDLGELAREVVMGLRETSPGASVEVEVQPSLVVRGDRTLLRQMLDNLIGNAWKFSAGREPARIEVGGLEQPTGGAMRTFYVRDNGIGFDSAAATGLFEPFYRAHDASQVPGTGLGLAIVRRIARAHGGTVWCESKEGQGATFFVSLPVPTAALPEAQPAG